MPLFSLFNVKIANMYSFASCAITSEVFTFWKLTVGPTWLYFSQNLAVESHCTFSLMGCWKPQSSEFTELVWHLYQAGREEGQKHPVRRCPLPCLINFKSCLLAPGISCPLWRATGTPSSLLPFLFYSNPGALHSSTSTPIQTIMETLVFRLFYKEQRKTHRRDIWCRAGRQQSETTAAGRRCSHWACHCNQCRLSYSLGSQYMPRPARDGVTVTARSDNPVKHETNWGQIVHHYAK